MEDKQNKIYMNIKTLQPKWQIVEIWFNKLDFPKKPYQSIKKAYHLPKSTESEKNR